jgi:predicted PurR-regulated permease PerM
MSSTPQPDYLSKSLRVAVHLGVVAAFVFGAMAVFSPFVMVVAWGAILAITFHPAYRVLCRLLGGSGKAASAVFVLVTLAVVLVPVWLLGDPMLEAARNLRQQADAGTLVIPPPPENVREWPLVGERVYDVWHGASVNVKDAAHKLEPQLRGLAERIAGGVSSLGRALVQSILAVVVAGVLMMNAAGAASAVQAIARKLGGESGPSLVQLSVSTVRNVVKGVLLVALIQGLLAAGGLAVAGVPFVGLWALAVTILAVAQLPPLLALAPIIPWVFAHNDSTVVAVFFAIWSVVVSFSDPFLKMLFLGRGVSVPMPVILIGAIGGMLRAGMVGLFVGPVILTIFYQLFGAWVRADEAAEPAPATIPPARTNSPG